MLGGALFTSETLSRSRENEQESNRDLTRSSFWIVVEAIWPSSRYSLFLVQPAFKHHVGCSDEPIICRSWQNLEKAVIAIKNIRLSLRFPYFIRISHEFSVINCCIGWQWSQIHENAMYVGDTSAFRADRNPAVPRSRNIKSLCCSVW